jgi:hypothetical protein
VRIRQISGGGSSRAYVNAGVGSFRRIALNGGDDETIGEVVERIEEVLAEMATRLAALDTYTQGSRLRVLMSMQAVGSLKHR